MNIREIASLAGVSVSAVSRYLNNGYVSEEKKERIREVIEKTGYRPSTQAQVLRTKKSKIIGVIVPKISSEAIARVVEGVSEVLTQNGYQMLLANTENQVEKELEYLSLFMNHTVDGIVFLATIFTKQHKALFKKLPIPLVIVGQKFEDYPCVYHDDYNAAKALTLRMLEAGRRQIGCIGVTERDEAAGRQRLKGYQDAMKSYGCSTEGMVIEAEFTLESGYAKIAELSRRRQIDGLFCATDNIAVGAGQYLKACGYRLPEDVAIAGVGHSRISRVVVPKLTTAHLYYKTSGEEGTKMLLEMIDKQKMISKQIQLGYEIIDGGSISKKGIS
jgi:LacI family sucrose operon transcriptional repressor